MHFDNLPGDLRQSRRSGDVQTFATGSADIFRFEHADACAASGAPPLCACRSMFPRFRGKDESSAIPSFPALWRSGDSVDKAPLL